VAEADEMLRAIRESPAEDGPRLIYANWLAENGELDRAEFIRVQCHIAKLNPEAQEALQKDLRAREQELLTANWRAWVRPLFESLQLPFAAPDLPTPPTRVAGRGWFAKRRRQGAGPPSAPAPEFALLGTWVHCYRQIGTTPLWNVGFVRGFPAEFTFSLDDPSHVEAVARLPSLAAVSKLWCHLSPEVFEVVSTKVDWRRFIGLRDLQLDFWPAITVGGHIPVPFVAHFGNLLGQLGSMTDLTGLHVYGPTEHHELRAAVCSSALFSRLRELGLSVTDESAAELWAVGRHDSLRRLALSGRLAANPWCTAPDSNSPAGASWCGLQSLDVRDVQFEKGALGRLSEWVGLNSLRDLTFSSCALDSHGLSLLLRSPRIRELRSLFIHGFDVHFRRIGGSNRFTGDNARALVESPAAPCLQNIDLSDLKIDGRTAAALAGLADAPNLHSLGLDSNAITDDGLQCLAGAAWPADFGYLDLSHNRVTDRAADDLIRLLEQYPKLHVGVQGCRLSHRTNESLRARFCERVFVDSNG
jgi:uncharacterized protein (TIGR02996 family)